MGTVGVNIRKCPEWITAVLARSDGPLTAQESKGLATWLGCLIAMNQSLVSLAIRLNGKPGKN